MKIIVKLFASLSEYLPPDAVRNQTQLEVADGTTPQAIIQQMGAPQEMCHLVLVNGIFVPPEERDTLALREQDQLAVFPPVAGG